MIDLAWFSLRHNELISERFQKQAMQIYSEEWFQEAAIYYMDTRMNGVYSVWKRKTRAVWVEGNSKDGGERMEEEEKKRYRGRRETNTVKRRWKYEWTQRDESKEYYVKVMKAIFAFYSWVQWVSFKGFERVLNNFKCVHFELLCLSPLITSHFFLSLCLLQPFKSNQIVRLIKITYITRVNRL